MHPDGDQGNDLAAALSTARLEAYLVPRHQAFLDGFKGKKKR